MPLYQPHTSFSFLTEANSAYPWEVNVWNDNLVERAWRILPAAGRVTAWVVLVGSVAAGLPRLGVWGLGDWVLGRRGGWVAGEVPSGKTESARHDREEDLLVVRDALQSGWPLSGSACGRFIRKALGRGEHPASGRPCRCRERPGRWHCLLQRLGQQRAGSGLRGKQYGQ